MLSLPWVLKCVFFFYTVFCLVKWQRKKHFYQNSYLLTYTVRFLLITCLFFPMKLFDWICHTQKLGTFPFQHSLALLHNHGCFESQNKVILSSSIQSLIGQKKRECETESKNTKTYRTKERKKKEIIIEKRTKERKK